MHCRILVLDDDQNVLNALRRELMRKPFVGTDGIELETFLSALPALERAAMTDGYFDVAIADYRMPDMNGIEFLTRFRVLQPDAVRILLSGMMDVDGTIEAINTARVDHILTKPWHEYDLKGRIALALHQRELRPPGSPQVVPARGPFSLLLVDDEPAQLHALERELAGSPATRQLFSVRAAASPEAALELASRECPDLVIADYAMPHMDGITLLHHLRELCPGCVRMLISGRADLSTLIDGINIAGVYHYLGKPWDPPQLRSAIAEALAYRDLLNASRSETQSAT